MAEDGIEQVNFCIIILHIGLRGWRRLIPEQAWLQPRAPRGWPHRGRDAIQQAIAKWLLLLKWSKSSSPCQRRSGPIFARRSTPRSVASPIPPLRVHPDPRVGRTLLSAAFDCGIDHDSCFTLVFWSSSFESRPPPHFEKMGTSVRSSPACQAFHLLLLCFPVTIFVVPDPTFFIGRIFIPHWRL